MPQGTPTNVTHEGEAHAPLDAVRWMRCSRAKARSMPTTAKTRSRTSPMACGSHTRSEFAGVPSPLMQFADRHDGGEAIAMKRALWAGTLGYYGQQMLSPLFENGTASG